MAFPLHNHCLCRVLGRVHAQSTEDVGLRGQTGMPHISSFLFCPFFCCWLLSDKTLGRIAKLISRIEGVPQSWSSTPLHYACLREKLPKICWSQTLIRWQASRHCQSAVDLNPGPHAVSFFFVCGCVCVWPSCVWNVTRSQQNFLKVAPHSVAPRSVAPCSGAVVEGGYA